MSKPEITFLIPTYNSAKSLPLTIQSVLSQIPEMNTEILVIDDASTDHTEESLSPFLSHPTLRVIKNEANQGAAYSRNLGIREAKGKYVILVDSDVRIDPTLGSVMLKEFESNHELDLIAPRINYETQGEFYPGFKEAALYAGVTACLGIRKDSLIRSGQFFDEAYGVYFEDTDFFIRLRQAGLKFKFMPEISAIHIDRSIRENNNRVYYLQIRNCLYALRKLRQYDRFPHELSWKLYFKYLTFGLLNYAWFNDWIQTEQRGIKDKIVSKFFGPHISKSVFWPFQIISSMFKSWAWNISRPVSNRLACEPKQ